QLLQPCRHLCLQALVLERETSGSCDLAHELLVVQETGCMCGDGERSSVPDEGRLLLALREHHRVALWVDEPVGVLERVGELERGAADDRGEGVTEPAARRRWRQLDHEPSNRRPAAPCASPAPGDAKRYPRECDGLAEPQASLEVAVPEKAVAKRCGIRR